MRADTRTGGGADGAAEPVFRYAWAEDGRACHLALGRDGDGWWFESLPGGRSPLVDGAAHLAAFARWLLEPRPEGPYEAGFPLVRGAPDGTVTEEGPGGARLRETALDVDVYLCRDEPGGSERLLAFPSASVVGTRTSYPVAAELVASPLDRERLRQAARALLAVTQPSICLIPAAPAAARRGPRTGPAGRIDPGPARSG
jgi:predicted dehydrogenase